MKWLWPAGFVLALAGPILHQSSAVRWAALFAAAFAAILLCGWAAKLKGEN